MTSLTVISKKTMQSLLLNMTYFMISSTNVMLDIDYQCLIQKKLSRWYYILSSLKWL